MANGIIGLGLTGGPLPGPGGGTMPDIGSNVYIQIFPDESNIKFPCVLVTTEGEKETPVGGTNYTIEKWRPVRVIICDRMSPARRHENEPYYLDWRDTIYNTFWHQRLASVGNVSGCEITPEIVFDPKLPYFQYIVTGMVLRFYTTESKPQRTVF